MNAMAKQFSELGDSAFRLYAPEAKPLRVLAESVSATLETADATGCGAAARRMLERLRRMERLGYADARVGMALKLTDDADYVVPKLLFEDAAARDAYDEMAAEDGEEA